MNGPAMTAGDRQRMTVGGDVSLRPVEPDDCALMYEWQCDAETRRFARDPSVPTWEQHCAWFKANPGCVMWVILFRDKPAGVLRFDRRAEQGDAYEISINIAPDMRGKGVAKQALDLGRAALPDSLFIACVLEGNNASHALFRTAGYHQGEDGVYRLPPTAPSAS